MWCLSQQQDEFGDKVVYVPVNAGHRCESTVLPLVPNSISVHILPRNVGAVLLNLSSTFQELLPCLWFLSATTEHVPIPQMPASTLLM